MRNVLNGTKINNEARVYDIHKLPFELCVSPYPHNR